jgi:hypothetical protein
MDDFDTTHLGPLQCKAAKGGGSIPSPPALPGFNGNTGLSVTPGRPVHPSRASGCSSLSAPRGFPCCVRFPCVHAVATTPAQRLGASSARFPSRVSLPRYGSRVGPRIVLFEAYSAFTCVTACTPALPPSRGTLHRRLQPFRYLRSCSGCFRLEPSPGGAFTHWESAAFSRRTPTPVTGDPGFIPD